MKVRARRSFYLLSTLVAVFLCACQEEPVLDQFPSELHGDWYHNSTMRELDCRIGLNSINLNDQLLMVDSVYRNDGLYEARLDGDRTLWWRFERVGDTLIIEQRSGELAYQELGRYTQDQP